ncbi:MAG: hypothetical protein ABWY77_00150 [Acidimicrobiia bacterium]
MSNVTRFDGSPTDPGDGDHSVLSAYLDGELTTDQRAQVDAELAASPELRAELEAVRSARVAVRDLPMRDLPDGFLEQMIADVGSAPDADAAVGTAASTAPVIDLDARRARRRRAVSWTIGAVAAAVVALAMFVLPGREQVRPNVTAVATQHGASDSNVGDPISGLVGLVPMRGGR